MNIKKNAGLYIIAITIILLSVVGYSYFYNNSNTINENQLSFRETQSENTSSDNEKTSSSELFTERDQQQTVDTSEAVKYEVEDGKNITILEEGTYVITGSAKNTTIIVEVEEEEKVQLVLNELTIENDNTPCIYVKKADKVFVTSMGTNQLSVTSTFTSDGNTNTDAVIFSKEDLVLNGTGSITISSTNNGITSKDDLKITGGEIIIDCKADAIEANDSISIKDGTINITTQKDGLHAEYDEDDSVGNIYIGGGTLNIKASDDAIHVTTTVQIDGGDITINSREGIEGTYLQINDGTINITATDDGMNAGSKSKKYSVGIEINGGSISINMGKGDTDAIDSNGDLYINGGTITINAQSPFDYDGTGKYTGGKIIVNGVETNAITSQMMGGRGGRR